MNEEEWKSQVMERCLVRKDSRGGSFCYETFKDYCTFEKCPRKGEMK